MCNQMSLLGYVYMSAVADRGQKRVSGPLDLLCIVMSCQMGVLGTKCSSSTRTVHILNFLGIEPCLQPHASSFPCTSTCCLEPELRPSCLQSRHFVPKSSPWSGFPTFWYSNMMLSSANTSGCIHTLPGVTVGWRTGL